MAGHNFLSYRWLWKAAPLVQHWVRCAVKEQKVKYTEEMMQEVTQYLLFLSSHQVRTAPGGGFFWGNPSGTEMLRKHWTKGISTNAVVIFTHHKAKHLNRLGACKVDRCYVLENVVLFVLCEISKKLKVTNVWLLSERGFLVCFLCHCVPVIIYSDH